MIAEPAPSERLLTLVENGDRGWVAIAVFDHPAVIAETMGLVRARTAGRILTARIDAKHRNPIDLVAGMGARAGDLVWLSELSAGLPEVLGFLDLQRERLVDLGVPVVLWVTAEEHRQLVVRAPHFYRYRDALLDFRRRSPTVFISATHDDLRAYRDAARDAALKAGCMPRMMEYWPASGDRVPLAQCLAEVSAADVVVAISAHQYGWVPEDQAPGEHRSITWLECARAAEEGKELLAFLVDEKQPWPPEHREEQRLAVAALEGKFTPELAAEVQRNLAGLREFKQWLGEGRIRQTFTSPEDLTGKVFHALTEWRVRNAPSAGAGAAATPSPETAKGDPTRYLECLLDKTAFIEIRGLEVGTGKAHKFPIEDLFISLTMSGSPGHGARGLENPEALPKSEKARKGKARPTPETTDPIEAFSASLSGASAPEGRGALPLDRILSERHVVVIGDPGAGKSTFLRRVASTLCEERLGRVANAAEARLGLKAAPFPIMVSVAQLVEHIAESRRRNDTDRPSSADDAGWLPHYLAAAGVEPGWGLGAAWFRRHLQSESCLVLLDGLDEAPSHLERGTVSRLAKNLAEAYPKARIVVTSRPAAYADEVILAGFAHATIDPLSDEAIGTFLARWCEALHRESPAEAASHRRELEEALAARIEIRRMARNPVMLTALAVVHWNERRLPEQRADLYQSIIRWLSRSRQRREGRLPAERCVEVLQELALAMFLHPEGRKIQVSKRWAAETIARELGSGARGRSRGATRVRTAPDRRGLELAERFLAEEELDSGIIVARGGEVGFWHLTFQEFLAARAIAARPDQEQNDLLLGEDQRVYLSEWREVVRLFGGVLRGQGEARVDAFMASVLDDLGSKPSLPRAARCVGVVGGVLADLRAVGYDIPDARYARLLEEVTAIFDRKRSESVPIKDRIEAAEALGQAGDPRLEPGNAGRWVTIGAGRFVMGAQKGDREGKNYDAEARDDETPHQVELDAFEIGRYPVTVAEYQRFVESDGYGDARWWSAGGFGKSGKPDGWEGQVSYPNRPVVGVSWFEASAFSRWAGSRLPTEAEWERAARGKEARTHPWGNKPAPDPSRANYSESGLRRATPVGIYPLGATPPGEEEGIQDLAGNVWEWCADWYGADYYSQSELRNPKGPSTSEYRVLRGGSWFVESWFLRSAIRIRLRPVLRLVGIGFRMVRELDARTQ